jgi:hypothetical protein
MVIYTGSYKLRKVKRKWLVVGIILMFVGTCVIPAIAQRINEPDTSLHEGLPDLTIINIVDEYYIEGPTLKCIVQNIGTAPSADYELQTDGYRIFGLLHVYDSYNHGFPCINPDETKYVECGCPEPFISILRLRCSISTSISEENYDNNRFAHSYFIANLDPFWYFKELPW